jgi:hypothetical protein
MHATCQKAAAQVIYTAASMLLGHFPYCRCATATSAPTAPYLQVVECILDVLLQVAVRFGVFAGGLADADVVLIQLDVIMHGRDGRPQGDHLGTYQQPGLAHGQGRGSSTAAAWQ